MIRKFLTSIAAALTLAMLATPATSLAFNPFGDVCGSGAANSSSTCTSQTTDNSISGPNGIIIKVTKLVALIAGVAAVIMILISAIRMITSGGDTNSVARARTGIINVLVGVGIILVSDAIVAFVVSKL